MNTHDGWAVVFNVHEQILNYNHMARQTADAKRKLKNCHYDGEKKGWDWDKHVTLHKEQHTIMESLADHGYSDIDDCTNIHCFPLGIKSTGLEAAINFVWAHPKMYGKDFVTTVSYLGLMVTKRCSNKIPLFQRPEVSWQSLKWHPLFGELNVRNTSRLFGIQYPTNSRCRWENWVNNVASSLPLSSLGQKLELLPLRLSPGLILSQGRGDWSLESRKRDSYSSNKKMNIVKNVIVLLWPKSRLLTFHNSTISQKIQSCSCTCTNHNHNMHFLYIGHSGVKIAGHH